MKATQSMSVLPANGVLLIKEGMMNRLFFGLHTTCEPERRRRDPKPVRLVKT